MAKLQTFTQQYGGWLRQNRLRARRRGLRVDIQLSELHRVYDKYAGKCGYCDQPSEYFDFAFPLVNKAPCIIANVLPCCEKCKIIKGHRSIIDIYKSGIIDMNRLHRLLGDMTTRKGNGYIREYLRQQLL